jgi:hypothetical protein
MTMALNVRNKLLQIFDRAMTETFFWMTKICRQIIRFQIIGMTVNIWSSSKGKRLVTERLHLQWRQHGSRKLCKVNLALLHLQIEDSRQKPIEKNHSLRKKNLQRR